MNLIRSFAPIVDNRTHVLVLGTMPGVVSLARGEYYAHRRNRFWRIMHELVGMSAEDEYLTKLNALQEAGIGLWDTLQECVRRGSLDSMIRSSEPNDFSNLLATCPTIGVIALNGAKAAHVFRRRVRPMLPAAINDRLTVLEFPSTSPANARVGFDALLSDWRALSSWIAAGP